ncbi:rod shape-determining protein MreC [Tissierella creatinini]|nr:rod shape-determining protein MreC [Tissierella creatinini]TJX63616.1 rod shape-determining protein MreC [Soehngenia saccharolytica]
MYFFKKYKDKMIVTIVTVILLIIIGNTSVERESISNLEKMVGNILTPISNVTYSIGNGISTFFGSIFEFVNVKEENDQLKERIKALESEKRDLENIIGKTDYLKNEAKILESTKHNIISAEITSKEPGNWYDRFVINKGTKDGIVKGSTVIQGVQIEQNLYQEGVVGRVVDVGTNWSKVITIVDELNSISFKVIRTQDGGVLSGDVYGNINGYFFDSKADVIVGDKLYSSGLGGSYLKDIYIGEVNEVFSDENELTKRISITPAINFKKLYKVFVLME